MSLTEKLIEPIAEQYSSLYLEQLDSVLLLITDERSTGTFPTNFGFEQLLETKFSITAESLLKNSLVFSSITNSVSNCSV